MKAYTDKKEIIESNTEKQKTAPRGGSLAGIHYVSLYECCQRRFHINYNMGVKQNRLNKALIQGSAVHIGKEIFYKTWDIDEAIKCALDECKDRRDEFIDLDDYEFVLGRIKPMLLSWYRTYGKDEQSKYNILAVEEEIRLPLQFTPGFVMTQRHDVIVEEKRTGNVYTMDTKTASSSLDFTLNSTRLSDQVTAYIKGGTEVYGSNYKGFIIDVLYWSTRSSNPGTIKCQRSDPIIRTSHELKVFETQMAGLFNEIQAKERSLKAGVPSPFLYRKNTYYCMSFFTKCPYADICSLPDQKIARYLPDHLEIVPVGKDNLDSLCYDTVFFGEA